MRAHRWQPLSTMMLCGLILLYTLPAAPIVLGVVVLVCLVVWWAVKRSPSPGIGKGKNSKFKNLIFSSVWFLVLTGTLYDIALIIGPQNSSIAALEDTISGIPLLHFAERYRAGAALMNEPLPNLAGFCLSIIAIISFATAASFQALSAEGRIFVPLQPSAKVARVNVIFGVMIGFSIISFMLNAIIALSEFSTSDNYRSYLFKMNFFTGQFVWALSIVIMSAAGNLISRDIELIYQRERARKY